MPSIQANIIKILLRINPSSWVKVSIQEQRSFLDRIARRYQLPKEIAFEQIDVNGVQAAWIKGPQVDEGVVLYLHGGAYALGSIATHCEFLGRFTSATQRTVLAINYRLAPEHPFPAALEDALGAFDWLLSQGFDPNQIAIAGDSAGGGLCLSTLVTLRDECRPMPACAVCISPWVDLTFSCPSIISKTDDPVLGSNFLSTYANAYAGEYPKDHPLISPLFANLEGLPPLLIQVGTDEILMDEAVLFATKAQTAGVDATLQTWEGMFHVFQAVPFLPESRKSLGLIEAFITSHLG